MPMNHDQSNFLELQSFLESFNDWQERENKRPLLNLQAFCKNFAELNKNQAIIEFVEPEKTLHLNDLHNFYEKFYPLYSSNIQHGAAINVWQQAGLKQDEVRNTAALAWWLDCNGSHDLKSTILEQLINTLGKPDNLPTLDQLGNYHVVTESLPLGDIEDRIDIEIQGDDFLIFIEVKINAKEGDGQLERYRKLLHKKGKLYGIEKRALVYLTCYEQQKSDVDCLCVSWRQLALVLERLKLSEEVGLTSNLLWQFCRHIQSF